MCHFYEFAASHYLDEKREGMSRRHFSYILLDWLEMGLLRCGGKWHTAHFGLVT